MQLLDYVEEAHCGCLVLELLPSGDLFTQVEALPLPLGLTLTLTLALALALALTLTLTHPPDPNPNPNTGGRAVPPAGRLLGARGAPSLSDGAERASRNPRAPRAAPQPPPR